MSEQTYKPGTHPSLRPPSSTVGVYGWIRSNLFSTPLNVALTLLGIYLIYVLIPPVIQWAFIDADWRGETRNDCSREGACWIFIGVWFKQLMYGRYPDDELWRINLAYVIVAATAVPLFMPTFRYKHWIGVFLLFIFPIIAFHLFVGLSKLTVEAWPYRLMIFCAIGLGVIGLLPVLNIWREKSRTISMILLVLVPIWGLSASSSWTSGTLAGASGTVAFVSVILVVVPAVVLALAAMRSPWREMISKNYWKFCVGTGVLALVGFMLPALFWNEIAGPSPPWPFIVLPAFLAMAAVCPWGYDEQAGGPGRLAQLLIPAYLVIVYLLMAGPPDALNFGFLDWTPNTKPFFVGAQSVLPFVETPLWGGLFLTLVIAVVGIVASLPIGIVLALGRRSNMPVVSAVCVAFIELWRGVPLITVLFMASVMFPLFMPEGLTFDKLLRALIGVTMFSAAYMAEVIRGGLQAIPRGQYEAAQALGLSFWKSMGLIILPQALKLVIPGIVNTFIGLFKDTTLVLIIGLFDLLGMVQLAGSNPDWLGFSHEGYVFAAFVFFIFCFSMSRYSQHLEKKLHTDH
jgi:His/Glu/Gln/Arg/opine family amino acid ABC transporter permease subunit